MADGDGSQGNSDSQSGTNDDLAVPEQSGLQRKGRRGPAELAAVKIQELERHKAIDCSKMSETQLAIYNGKTASLELAIKNFEAKQQKSQGGVKRQLSTASEEGSEKRQRTVWTLEDVTRLIHARTMLNDIFQQHNNNMLQKWDLVTAAFNNGFSHKDKTFPELPADKHLGKDVVKHKFEDLTANMRRICMAEEPTKKASMINQKTYEGSKRDVAEIENEIMEEIAERKRKFRFYEIMCECGWRERDICNPKPRMNVGTSDTVSMTSSSCSTPVSKQSSTAATPSSQATDLEDGGRLSDGDYQVKGRLGGGATDSKTGNAVGRPRGTQRNTTVVADIMKTIEKSERDRREQEKESGSALVQVLKEALSRDRAPSAMQMPWGGGWGGWGGPPFGWG